MTEEQYTELMKKLDEVLFRLDNPPVQVPWPNLNPNPPWPPALIGCQCPEGAVCMNVMCPRRPIVTYVTSFTVPPN